MGGCLSRSFCLGGQRFPFLHSDAGMASARAGGVEHRTQTARGDGCEAYRLPDIGCCTVDICLRYWPPSLVPVFQPPPGRRSDTFVRPCGMIRPEADAAPVEPDRFRPAIFDPLASRVLRCPTAPHVGRQRGRLHDAIIERLDPILDWDRLIGRIGSRRTRDIAGRCCRRGRPPRWGDRADCGGGHTIVPFHSIDRDTATEMTALGRISSVVSDVPLPLKLDRSCMTGR